MPHPPGANPFKLTPRERQVLTLVASGLTSKASARHLNIHVRTVEAHRFNLMQKMKVRNAAQLLRLGLINGLISL